MAECEAFRGVEVCGAAKIWLLMSDVTMVSILYESPSLAWGLEKDKGRDESAMHGLLFIELSLCQPMHACCMSLARYTAVCFRGRHPATCTVVAKPDLRYSGQASLAIFFAWR